MKPVHVLVIMIAILVALLGVNLLLDVLFPTPDPVDFARSLGVPVQ